MPGGVRRFINVRSAVIGNRPKFDLSTLVSTSEDRPSRSKPATRRQVYFEGSWHDTAVYDRLSLPVDSIVQGPAVLMQSDTTILIEPGLQGRVDSYGNTVIERTSQA